MSLSVYTNLNALSSQRSLAVSDQRTGLALQRLSSGLRINSARDDAAGLAIAQRMTSLIRGTDQAARNMNDGISMAQTMDGAMQSATGILQRLRELAVQAANATNRVEDRQALNREATGLVAELDRIARNTEFNGQSLLDGTLGTARFQVGAQAHQTIVTAGADLRTTVYGLHQTNGGDGGGIAAQYAAWGANGIIAGALTIAGPNGSGTVNVAANQSARQIAEAINAVSTQTGVTASARTTVRLAFATSSAHTLTIRSSNDDPITFNFVMTSTQADGYEQVAAAFNQIADQTGVTARTAVISPGVTRVLLTNDSGDDIQLSDAGIASEGGTGITKFVEDTYSDILPSISLLVNATVESIVTSGSLALSSASAFSVNSTTNAYVAGQSSSTLKTLSTLDLSTAAGAQTAIRLSDAALQTVNTHRARLGAVMSRFEATIGHLKVTSENMSAARSRIEDADFASETANLSKAQILQQAGTAMVAQANQLPRQVLNLLG